MGYVRTEGYLTHLRGYGTQGALRIEGIPKNRAKYGQSLGFLSRLRIGDGFVKN